MACSSWSWPNMFDVARSQVNLYNDARSIVNRVKLLLLTDPTELYMNPTFGVGLRKHLFKYNNDNVIANIQAELIEQLKLWEPAVIAEETKVTRGLDYTADPMSPMTALNKADKLELTVTLTTTYMKVVTLDITSRDLNGFSR